MTIESPNRRAVLGGVAIIGAGAALTACGGSSDTSGTPAATTSAPSDTPSATPSTSATTTSGGTPIGKTSDVPVGSGKIFTDKKVVVTQLTKGHFKAFTAVCTHLGCIVSSIDTKEIHCACHGSAYSIKDGSVVSGPAPAPLKAEKIADDAGTLKLT